ncbi:MAG TPA: nucleotidyltransferase domain-containing protein [Candidatus Nanoarchaeia archaeon]|nr:nucleotidyltransferase domain-containing protein [Candidatus Nanoarchaeia archaeon]
MNPLKPLFFEQTLRHWHFEAIVQASALSRERVNFYLKELMNKKFIVRVKPKCKMPYYTTHLKNPSFRMEKRLFGLNLLQESGLFDHLYTNQKIKTAILFGSFARGDWGKSSDVDLFIYGDDADFEKGMLEHKLGKEIQIFSFSKPEAIKNELESSLIPNIIKGLNIKGTLEPFEVSIHA